jgi:hypothetical protein
MSQESVELGRRLLAFHDAKVLRYEWFQDRREGLEAVGLRD